ncbi:MAG: hypothetical protein R6W68_10690 [Ignavibacteriaceae bacterium]
MKTLFFLFAVSLPLLFIGCADSGQEISPLFPETSAETLESKKTAPDISHPFRLYENLPELTNYTVSWIYHAKGLTINVNTPKKTGYKLLFAVIDFIDVDNAMHSAQMVYLGNSTKDTYLISGINKRAIGSIRIYGTSSSQADRSEPYKESQVFRNIMVHGWSDGSTDLKISSEKFPSGLRNLFAELTANEVSALVYLGKPAFEDFDFPKSEKLRIKNVRLMCLVTKQVSVDEPNADQ